MNGIPPELPYEQQSVPWGFWATIGFSVIVVVMLIIIQTISIFLIFIIIKRWSPEIDIEMYAKTVESNGLMMSMVALITAPFIIGPLVFFAWLKKGITIKEYFSWYRVEPHIALKWIGIFILCVICSDLVAYLSGHDIVPEWAVDTYSSAGFVPLLWLALIVAAPLYEEVLFRGFIFKGIQYSKAGPVWAIIVTSLVWASIHTQYEIYHIVTIFLFGLLLGYVRLKSNSILLPIGLHSLMNLFATIETIVYMKYFLK